MYAGVVHGRPPLRDHERLARIGLVEVGRPHERVGAEVVVVVAVDVEEGETREIVPEAVARNRRLADRERVPDDRQLRDTDSRERLPLTPGIPSRRSLRVSGSARAAVRDEVDALEGLAVPLRGVRRVAPAGAVRVERVVHLAERPEKHRLAALGNGLREPGDVGVALPLRDRTRADGAAAALGLERDVRPVAEASR